MIAEKYGDRLVLAIFLKLKKWKNKKGARSNMHWPIAAHCVLRFNMAEKLTEESARQFAENLFKSKMKGLEKRFIIQHTKGVIKTALNLAKGKKVDLESIKIAGWLHDVGRAVNIENHAEISVKLAEENFGALNDVVKDCILNHGSSKNPQTKEGKIIQLADKLSIMNDFKLFKIVFAKEKYKEKSIEMVKMVSDDLIEVLKRYNWEE